MNLPGVLTIDGNFYLDLSAAGFDMILLLRCLMTADSGRTEHAYRHMVICLNIAAIADSVMMMGIFGDFGWPVFLKRLLIMIDYGALAGLALSFLHYLMLSVGTAGKRNFCWWVNYTVTAAYMGALIVNAFTGFMIDAEGKNGGMVRGGKAGVYVAVTFLWYFIYAFILLIRYRSALTRKQLLSISLFIALEIAGILLQEYFGTRLKVVVLFASVGTVGLFFTMESPDYRRLIDVMGRLSKAEKEADEASLAKSRFLASMTHEIRTPMNAILGMNDLILKDASEPDVRAYASAMKESGENLLSVINEILDYSRIESGKEEVQKTVYSLGAILARTGDGARKAAAGKNISYMTDIDDDLPDRLTGDGVKVEKIIRNLVDNAISYTMHGSVLLTVRGEGFSRADTKAPYTLVISVTDTGPGIAEEDRDLIFESFRRRTIEGVGAISGTGLGLTIARSLARMMGGDISLQTETGEGSIFTLRIPVSAASKSTLGDIRRVREMGLTEKDSGPAGILPLRVLVVDDNSMNIRVAEGFLHDLVRRTDSALSGEEALQKMQGAVYDAVFLDHRMPGMEGPEVLRRARAQDKALGRAPGATRYIALTASTGGDWQSFYREAGFDGYLPKPLRREDLEKVLSNIAIASSKH